MEREAATLTAVRESRSEREAGRMVMAFEVDIGAVKLMLDLENGGKVGGKGEGKAEGEVGGKVEEKVGGKGDTRSGDGSEERGFPRRASPCRK